MEVIIANHHRTSFSFAKSKKDKDEFKRIAKFSKNSTKEVMSISKVELVWITERPNLEEKRSALFKDTIRRCPTLTELQEKTYPFPNSDLSGILDELFVNGMISLPEPKRHKEVGRTTDPKYCHYCKMASIL